MQRAKRRWHIAVFLAPAVIVYSAVMIFPLFNTLRLALYSKIDQERVFVGMENFRTLFFDPVWADQFWNALGNNFWFFVIHM
ncbi:MAG: sugar ABC transporter permease, partial [Paracoccaceae bacterium]